MTERMNMPMRSLSKRLAELHVSERLIRKKVIDNDEYFYLDYEWFYEVVQFRLRHMEEVLKKREEKRRGGHLYKCPRCGDVITAAELAKNMDRGGHCIRCADSGDVPRERLSKECTMEEVPRDTADIQDQRQQMRQQLCLDQSFSSARALLAHLKMHEDAGRPMFPIPLRNILDSLKEFKDKGIPRGGFSTNTPRPRRASINDDDGDGDDKAAFAKHMETLVAKRSALSSAPLSSGGAEGDTASTAVTDLSRKRSAAVLADDMHDAIAHSGEDDEQQRKRRAYAEEYRRKQEALKKEMQSSGTSAGVGAAGERNNVGGIGGLDETSNNGVADDDDDDEFEDG